MRFFQAESTQFSHSHAAQRPRRLAGWLRGAALALLTTASAGAQATPPPPAAAPRSLLDEYVQWVDREFPERAFARGRNVDPTRVTDHSVGAIERRHREEIKFLAQASAALPQAEAADRLDLSLLLGELERSTQGHRFRRWLMPVHHRGGPQQSLPTIPDDTPFRHADDVRWFVTRMEQQPTIVAQTHATLEQGLREGMVPSTVAMGGVLDQFAAVERGGLRGWRAPVLREWAGMDDAERGVLLARVDAARTGSLSALRATAEFLRSQYIPACHPSTAAVDQPMGREYYHHQLWSFTTTRLTAQQIHDLGVEEVARIRTEMMAVIEKTPWAAEHPAGSGQSEQDRFDSFVSFLRSDPQFVPASAESLLAGYRDICKRIDAELPRFFGRLPQLPYGVREIPAFMAPSQTTAYYQPGSLETGLPGWFCANTYALSERPTYDMIPLSLHEAVPGHHLQIAISQELTGHHRFRRDLHYTVFVEGWALYAERLGIEMGFYERDPYADFGRLGFEQWRACRLVVDTGIHTFGWSRERAIAFMRDNTGLSDLNIEREVDRYIAWPGQATGYKIGEIAIRRMRTDAQAALGADFDLRAFHDHLLGAGALPLDVLEERMAAWTAAQRLKRPTG
ncbi:MAG: DUF885 domain-containing protein [Planctomycetota bacterium]|nr:DUF885 domain-containing protein [Planctomycetota bacterium]MDA1105739.1 DUF885 domain-containing protein [Planctomycetota bacterium]